MLFKSSFFSFFFSTNYRFELCTKRLVVFHLEVFNFCFPVILITIKPANRLERASTVARRYRAVPRPRTRLIFNHFFNYFFSNSVLRRSTRRESIARASGLSPSLVECEISTTSFELGPQTTRNRRNSKFNLSPSFIRWKSIDDGKKEILIIDIRKKKRD